MTVLDGPDIVIITIDALRRDALGCYGGRLAEHGLQIDAFAERAIVYENHYAAATSSLMSLYTWYSGLPAHMMPIRNLSTATLPAGDMPTLGGVLAGAGYRRLTTMEERCGHPEVEEVSAGARNYRREPVFAGFEEPPFPDSFPGMPGYKLYGIAEKAVPYALEWFRGTPGKRFLHLWVTDLHIAHRYPRFRPAAGLESLAPRVSDPNPVVRTYYDAVAHVDAVLGPFLHALNELSPDLLIVIGSDHGESLGERPARLRDAEWFCTDGMQYDHGYPNQIDNHLINTPLILRPPGRFVPQRVTELVSAVDFFSTVLGYAVPGRVPLTPELARRGLSRSSQVQHGPWPGRELTVSHTRWLSEPDWSSALVTSDGWKLIKFSDQDPELYFLPEDREERHNIFSRASDGRRLLDALEDIERSATEHLGRQRPWAR